MRTCAPENWGIYVEGGVPVMLMSSWLGSQAYFMLDLRIKRDWGGQGDSFCLWRGVCRGVL